MVKKRAKTVTVRGPFGCLIVLAIAVLPWVVIACLILLLVGN